jgi:uncharacterized protein (TIGR03437 family)
LALELPTNRMRVVPALILIAMLSTCACASESDALAIDAAIQARHMPFGTILDPIYSSSTGTTIVGYTRCGDSALWTGAYLAAESFRYAATQSSAALANVKTALAGIASLVDVTGDNRVARCVVPANSPFAAGIASEESANTVRQAPPFIWIDNTSRDEVVGVFFGLGTAYDLVDDAAVKSSVSNLATLIAGFIARHQWSPNDDVSNTFLLRPEELAMLLAVTNHVNPANGIQGPPLTLPVATGASVDVLGVGSYFKFNLDYMSFFELLRLENASANLAAYRIVRTFTASHQNPFFDLIDRAINGPDAARDAETVALLNEWLGRSDRDFSTDASKTVGVCNGEACAPIPVALRPPTDFLWQRDPFQLAGGGSGVVESSGIDYILPYWMARYYGLIGTAGVAQSAAAAIDAVTPGGLASIYGANLAAAAMQAAAQPLPTILGGASLSLTDAAGVTQSVPLAYASPAQINLQVPDGAAVGLASLTVNNGITQQMYQVAVQNVAPAIFTMNGAGTGVAAATAERVSPSSVQTPVTVFQCGDACVATPIAVAGAPVYLTLYGSGIRGRSVPANVSVAINGVTLSALYAGPAPGFVGLDQVNVQLPSTLAGAGICNVTITVDGQTSNVATIAIQ